MQTFFFWKWPIFEKFIGGTLWPQKFLEKFFFPKIAFFHSLIIKITSWYHFCAVFGVFSGLFVLVIFGQNRHRGDPMTTFWAEKFFSQKSIFFWLFTTPEHKNDVLVSSLCCFCCFYMVFWGILAHLKNKKKIVCKKKKFETFFFCPRFEVW